MKLYNFEVGDKVAIYKSYGRLLAIQPIERVTPTLAIVPHGRYRRDTGRLYGLLQESTKKNWHGENEEDD